MIIIHFYSISEPRRVRADMWVAHFLFHAKILKNKQWFSVPSREPLHRSKDCARMRAYAHTTCQITRVYLGIIGLAKDPYVKSGSATPLCPQPTTDFLCRFIYCKLMKYGPGSFSTDPRRKSFSNCSNYIYKTLQFFYL